MRSAAFAVLFGTSAFIAVPALAQTAASPSTAHTAQPAGSASAQTSGPADLCKELLAYAEKKAAEPPKPSAGQAGQAATSAAAPPPRTEGRATGTQGGGSAGPSTSTDTSSQTTAPPTAPTTTGAASEAAASPYASDSSTDLKIGGMAMQQVLDTAKGNDRQACRDTTQKLRHAGADLPAALIALAAYEPDPAKRQ